MIEDGADSNGVNNNQDAPQNANATEKRECPEGRIDGVSSAKRYRGCTHINGSLVISFRRERRQRE